MQEAQTPYKGKVPASGWRAAHKAHSCGKLENWSTDHKTCVEKRTLRHNLCHVVMVMCQVNYAGERNVLDNYWDDITEVREREQKPIKTEQITSSKNQSKHIVLKLPVHVLQIL